MCKKICQKLLKMRNVEMALILAALTKKEYCYFRISLEIMSGKFKAIIKIMQNQIQVKNSFSWKPASKFIQFAFEEGGLRPFGREEDQEENLENGSPRKILKPEEQEEQELENSYQPSNQVIDFQKAGRNNQSIQIQVTGHQVVDEVSHTCVFVSKANLPTLSVSFPQSSKTESDQQGIPQKSKYIELFLAQKSHSSEYEKYKIIRGGVRGTTREKIKGDSIKLEKIRFNYLSNPQKLPRLILVLYQQIQNRRHYKSIMISDEFSVIDNHKALFIQYNDHLKLYFEPIQTHFLDKTGLQIGKITSLNKHKILEEMSTFENYLIKKNKKIWNIVYAAYKYSHIIDLYFLSVEGKTKKDQFLQLWKEVIQSFRAGQVAQSERTCNHLNSSAKFVLKIHAQMRNVRFIMNKELTKHLSIIASQTEFDTANGKWVKFDTINDMKDAYILCQAEIQAKIISEPIVAKTNINLTSSLVHPTSAPVDPQKKSAHHSKNDDDDFNEEDVEDEDDDVEYEGQSSQNYSVSNRKRGRKLGQKKIPDVKKQGNVSYKQNKYTTRGGNRMTRNKEETQDSNDKRANMIKKNKEKESFSRAPIPTPVIGAPPFRVLTPAQAGQYKDQQTQSLEGKMIGLFPMVNPQTMMMGAKKPEDQKNPPSVMPKGVMPVMLPAGMNPQMMAMLQGGLPGGMMQIMPMGNGMQAVMMPAQMDKNQAGGQAGMAGLGAMSAMGMTGMPGMGAIPGMPGMAGMTGVAGMPGMGGMGGMSGMMPFMMGGSGMPQGFMMPMMPQQGQNQSADKSKQAETDKQKQQQGEKKQEKKDHFPPQMPVEFSKMGMIGQMPSGVGMMPSGQMGGMQMPQFMQMGMPGMPGMTGMAGMAGMAGMGGMMGGTGMPQGIMMNPMMAMSKPTGQSKQEGATKQPTSGSMPNPMMGGSMPFMMAPVPSQIQGGDTSSQTPSGMQMGMMGQYPALIQMPQQSQLPTNPSQGGMPMGYTMMLSPEQSRSMSPAQLQQLQMQMQMMMSKGMMPAMMQMPKNDQNDQSKK